MRIKLPDTVKITDNTIVVTVCTAILFISSWAPFSETSPLGTDALRTILNYSQWILVAVGVLMTRNIRPLSSLEMTAVISVLIYRAFNIFHAFDYRGIGLTTIVIGLFFCYVSCDVRAKVFIVFKYMMVAVSIYGIICYISYFVHLGIPYTVIPRGDGVDFIDYKLCYLMNQFNTLIRFNGFFEEPGWFGTWAAFYLCADGMNLKKRENIILFVAGLLTLSLAFFLLIIFYYILKNLSEWKNWIWVVVLAMLYLLVLPNVHTGNYVIDSVLERMVITSEGLAGDNRYGSLFESVWQETISTGKIIFGQGAGYAEYYGTGQGQGLASIKSYVVNFGIIGTVVMYIPLLLAAVRQAIKEKNQQMLFFIIISYVSLYQRPGLFLTPNFIIFLCGIAYTGLKTSPIIDKNQVLLNSETTSTVHRLSLTI